jgi:sugar transferase (PEP-CTERM/EpsH1 system associated)
MKILFLTARIPYPLNTGGKIRAYFLLKALASRHQVTMLTFYGSEAERAYFHEIESLGVKINAVFNPEINRSAGFKEVLFGANTNLPVTALKYRHKEMEATIQLVLTEGYDAIQCESLHLVHYLDNYSQPFKILDCHNVEAQIAERHAEVEQNLLKKVVLHWNWRKMLAYEMKAVAAMDLVLAVSGNDRQTFARYCIGDKVALLENGVDLSYFTLQEPISSRKAVFVGSMDWLPNLEGIKFFIKEILPLVRAILPEFEISIVGKDPPASLLTMASSDPLLHVTGTVDDVRPYVAAAALFLVPLQFGGGTRLKILEAFAMGRAVISTSLGSEGIDCRDGEHLLIADTPVEFANAVLRLISDRTLQEQLIGNARQLVLSKYDWEAIGRRLLSCYERIK